MYIVENFIDGKDVVTGEYKDVNDPGKKNSIIGKTGKGNQELVNAACEAAYLAFKQWKNYSVEERAELLIKAMESFADDVEELSGIHSLESGVLPFSSFSEIRNVSLSASKKMKTAVEALKPVIKEDGNCYVKVNKDPMGVVAAITTWNVPFSITFGKILAPLVAGNTVVLKTSENFTLSLTMALKKFALILPPGVLNIIHSGDEVGASLSSNKFIRKVTLTGGARTASSIIKAGADTIKRFHFELGGNAAAVVFEDADIEKTVEELVGKTLFRCGQICVATKRIYVHKNIYRQFTEKFCNEVDKFVVGYQFDEETTFGPMNNEKQYNFVRELIQRTKESGAKVIELGIKNNPAKWDEGYYIMPTIVLNADPLSEVVLVEQFGPVVPIVMYDDEERVLEYVNGTEYGLSSSVWTKNFEHGLKFAEKIESGGTLINGKCNSPLPEQIGPFGGVKQSGVGWVGTDVGFLEYINYHTISYNKNQ